MTPVEGKSFRKSKYIKYTIEGDPKKFFGELSSAPCFGLALSEALFVRVASLQNEVGTKDFFRGTNLLAKNASPCRKRS